jgi:hypothetical protein
MIKKSLVLGLSLVITCSASAQPKKGQIDLSKVLAPQWHYQSEYTFDAPVDTVQWTTQTPGLHAAFGSTDELYLRCEAPELGRETSAWNAAGWRGERLNAQILVWSPDSLHQVRFKVSDLMNSGGKLICGDRIRLNMIRYVVSNLPYAAENFSCDVTADSAYLMPDRLESFERFDLPARTVRPVWIALDIPASSEPGDYHGTLGISALEGTVTLKVNLTVQKQVLPGPRDWKFRLDLWQNPWAVAWTCGVEPWSDEHTLLLKKHLKLYADAGGKIITTYAVHSPWSDNSYWIEGTMIEWIKETNGSWKFDYSIFDRYVELAMESGIDGAITLYTPVPWGHRFRYLDRRSGDFIHEAWSPASGQYKTFWNLFLDDLKAHLIRKGWFEKTYLGINENPLEDTIAAAGVIRENSKNWKITYAGNWHPELSSLLNDYSVILDSEPGQKELLDRASMGFTTTYYICCTPPHPNTFVFSPPAEGRAIGWYAAVQGYDGFLRWAYDAWPADPVRDARHALWPAGDCFLVYPGGNSSIRFEKLREGIVDYEKILILRESASKSREQNVKRLMKDLEAHLAAFAGESGFGKRDGRGAGMTGALRKGKKLIEDLSDAIGR